MMHQRSWKQVAMELGREQDKQKIVELSHELTQKLTPLRKKWSGIYLVENSDPETFCVPSDGAAHRLMTEEQLRKALADSGEPPLEIDNVVRAARDGRHTM
jgi:hypothetical protein